MTANIDPNTNIAYGSHGPNRLVADLVTEVFDDGTNVSEKRLREDIEEACWKARFVDVHDGETAEQALKGILKACNAELEDDVIKAFIEDHYDVDDERGTFDAPALARDILQAETDHGLEIDEPTYIKTWRDDKDRVLAVAELHYFGGAPHLRVLKSVEATWCAACSPCMPNAGDLDSPRTALEGGTLAYCIPAAVRRDHETDYDGAPTPWYKQVVLVHHLTDGVRNYRDLFTAAKAFHAYVAGLPDGTIIAPEVWAAMKALEGYIEGELDSGDDLGDTPEAVELYDTAKELVDQFDTFATTPHPSLQTLRDALRVAEELPCP